MRLFFRRHLIMGALLLAASAVTMDRQASAKTQVPSATLIRDVRIFDGEKIIKRGSVLIKGGFIVKVAPQIAPPSGAVIVDGNGRTLLPGLIDGHVHMLDAGPVEGVLGLEQAAMYGVTTVLDLGVADPVAYQDFKRRIKAGEFPQAADVFTAGVPATAPGGHGDMLGKNPTLTGADQAEAWVAERVATGSDYIKIISETFAEHGRNIPTLSDDTIAAVVAAAHRHGKLAVVHTLQQARAKNAIKAGADGLAHISPYDPPDPDFGTFMKQYGAFQSTNMISYAPPAYKAALAADPDLAPLMPPYMIRQLSTARAFPDAKHTYSIGGLKLLTRAGVPIIAGTDIGYPYAPLLHGELEIMVHDGGMTPTQALKSATSTPARIYRLTDRGRIASGARADLVLVEGDPARDIKAVRHIVSVWKQGHEIDREAIRQAVFNTPEPAPPGPPPKPASK